MATGSVSVSGLLGGTAGQIDTTSLISQLMQAQAIPQTQLKVQLNTLQSQLSAYQAINTKATALRTAAQALTDPTAWKATTAVSSSPAVLATSTGAAVSGSTTFSVTQLARAQVTTVAADSSGNIVSIPANGIRLKDADGDMHDIALSGGSALDVAAAINAANIGVRASVVQTTAGAVLQVSSAKSGTANTFTVEGTDATPKNVVAAQDAKATVGDPASGGYSVTSSSNTFTGLIQGVTFSANALASDVTVTINSDSSSISAKVQTLVNAANSALFEISADTAKGAVLQSRSDARGVSQGITSAVSRGVADGGSLKTYGIDLDATGKLTFDATVFAAAYAADPTKTQAAISGSFAASLSSTADAAVAPTTGTISSAITAGTTRAGDLNTEIDAWSTRLVSIQANLQSKYAAMQTALARLQSQQTYLTSMFDGMNNKSDS